MKASEIRQAFLDYFKRKGHTIVPSSSLVPDDPTLLFTNAGMVQFKNAFLGLEKRPYTRAASCQKCMRVSGKHNDLEEVGPSPRHHTYFEMLGNFSFGDYFKREAIRYAYEFVTQVLGVDPKRLIFTVHTEDDEAPKYWLEIPGVKEKQVLRMGDATNFWSMGDIGPCGPTSEIHVDLGPQACSCGEPDCSVALDNGCGRWLEIWNLVFMQYDQAPDGTRTPLPKPGVDTGMGLERIASVLQDAPTNYDTDIFKPIMERIRRLAGHSEREMEERIVSYRVIADHSRAMTFLIADGVVPGNEECSYVLRMLIRRAIRFGVKLGLEDPFLGEVAQTVIDMMGDFYPELKERRDFILKAIAQEEERFWRTYQAGMEWIERLLAEKERKGDKVITGEEAFFLHDTHGFHVQIVEDIARERGFSVDRAGFEREMQKQRVRSQTLEMDVKQSVKYARVSWPQDLVKEFSFTGYDKLVDESQIELLMDAPLDTARVVPRIDEDLFKGTLFSFIVKNTPFYAESGGQKADTGIVINESRQGKAEIVDTVRAPNGIHIHIARLIEGSFEVGDSCELYVDTARRKKIQRNHTATHILHAALREVLGHKGGIQAGSLVAPDTLRFDFTHFAPLTDDEIKKIEEIANHVILSDLPVEISHMTLEEAKSKGAMALFPEDYQGKERVRVVMIVEDGKPFSIELCGGTHVRRTGEIGLFKIVREEGVAAGVRRVYVATGENLLRHLEERECLLRATSQMLKASDTELISKLEALLHEREALERELRRFKSEWLTSKRDELLQRMERMDDYELVIAQVNLSIEELQELADLLEGSLERGIVLLGSAQGGKVVLVCKVSDSVTDRLSAGEIVREVAQLVGGKGGGTPRFARGGGPQPERLTEALASIAQKIREELSA